jgi:hypothetical protein
MEICTVHLLTKGTDVEDELDQASR